MPRPPHTPAVFSARQTLLAHVSLVITMVIWASAFPGIKRVLRETDAFALSTARMLIAASALLVVALVRRVGLPRKQDMLQIALSGLTGFTCYHLCLNLGLVSVPAGLGSFLIATTPLWTSLLARRFLRERLGLFGVLGLGTSLLGVAVSSLAPGELVASQGVGLILCSALCASVNLILQKRLLERYAPLELSAHVTLAGAIPFLFYLPFCAERLMPMSPQAWGVTLYLGLGPIGLGYVLSTYALRILPASRASQMLLLVPPIASLIAWFWLGETPDTRHMLGGLVILCGVLLGGLNRRDLPSVPLADLDLEPAGHTLRDPALEALDPGIAKRL